MPLRSLTLTVRILFSVVSKFCTLIVISSSFVYSAGLNTWNQQCAANSVLGRVLHVWKSAADNSYSLLYGGIGPDGYAEEEAYVLRRDESKSNIPKRSLYWQRVATSVSMK